MGRIKQPKSKKLKTTPLGLHIGGKLLELRQKHQVSLRKLAAEIGMGEPALCQIENGKHTPCARTFWRMSWYFDVPVDYWFEGYEEG